MSIVYQIEKEPGITYVVWDGVVTADQFLAHVQRLLADPDWPPAGRLHLTDLRTASIDASVDEAVLKKVADLYGQYPETANLRAAIVAGAAFLRAGEFEKMTWRYPMFVFVFNTLNPACDWLGIDPDQAEGILRPLRGRSRGEIGS